MNRYWVEALNNSILRTVLRFKPTELFLCHKHSKFFSKKFYYYGFVLQYLQNIDCIVCLTVIGFMYRTCVYKQYSKFCTVCLWRKWPKITVYVPISEISKYNRYYTFNLFWNMYICMYSLLYLSHRSICVFLVKCFVQQSLGEVNTLLKQPVLVNWSTARFYFGSLKEYHHKWSIKPVSAAWPKLMTLAGQSGSTCDFSDSGKSFHKIMGTDM